MRSVGDLWRPNRSLEPSQGVQGGTREAPGRHQGGTKEAPGVHLLGSTDEKVIDIHKLNTPTLNNIFHLDALRPAWFGN